MVVAAGACSRTRVKPLRLEIARTDEGVDFTSSERFAGIACSIYHWARAAELATAVGRVARIDDVHERIAAWTAGIDDRELSARLQRHGVAAAPVLNVADLLGDPHYRARGTFIEVQNPLGFKETIYGAYVKTSRTEANVRTGPRIGQDNDWVFTKLLGLRHERYQELVAAQVIY